MVTQRSDAHWGRLQAMAHLPEVQELIRRGIREGRIRVGAARDGGIRVIPCESAGRVPLDLPAPALVVPVSG
jgi:hypothetical protein